MGEGAIWAASGDEGVIRRIALPIRARPPAVKPNRPPTLRAPWRRPATIAGSSATSVVGLDLAVGDRGRSAAIWKTAERRGKPSVVSAVRAAGAASWMPARRLGQGAGNFFTGTPRVEMTPAGEAAALWTRGGGSLAIRRCRRFCWAAGAGVVGSGHARRPVHREHQPRRGDRGRRLGPRHLDLPLCGHR